MGYKVMQNAGETVVSVDGLSARVGVEKPAPGTAFAIGTLYRTGRSFEPVKVYYFQATSEQVDVEKLKRLAGFFFASLLDTELYIVEISRDSSLFPEEAARIFGTTNYVRAI